MPVSPSKQPIQGRQSVTATAKPLTQIGLASSGATTFTTTGDTVRVTDGAAWDLSNVEVDMVAVSSAGWRGRVRAVNNVGNYIDVYLWQYTGRQGDMRAAAGPDDGETVVIHKMEACNRVVIDALDANSNDVFLGFASDVTASGAKAGQPIAAAPGQPNHRLVLELGLGRHIDLIHVYVIVAAGTEEVAWVGM